MGDAACDTDSQITTQAIVHVSGITKVGIYNEAFEDIDFEEGNEDDDPNQNTLYVTSLPKQNGHITPLHGTTLPVANGHLNIKDSDTDEHKPQINGISKEKDKTIPEAKQNGHVIQLEFQHEDDIGEHSFAELFDHDISSEDGQGALFDLETGQLVKYSNVGPSLSAHQLALLASPLRRIKSPHHPLIRTRNGYNFMSWTANRKLPNNAQKRKPDSFLLVTFALVLILIVVAIIVVPILWVTEIRGSSSSSFVNTTSADAAT